MGKHNKPRHNKLSILLCVVAAIIIGIFVTTPSGEPIVGESRDIVVPIQTQSNEQVLRVEKVRNIVEEQEPITLTKVYDAARAVDSRYTEITVTDYLTKYPIAAVTEELKCKEGFEPRSVIIVDHQGAGTSDTLCYKAESEVQVEVPPIIFDPLVSVTNYSSDAGDRGWGSGWPSNHKTVEITTDRSGTTLRVEPRIAKLVKLLLDETERRGYMIDPSDSGGYSNRPIAGTNVASNHSWGLAVDLNVSRNPQTGRLITDMPDWMPELWNQYGFAWGGHYGSGTLKDAMHYEFMGTPANAAELTTLAERNLVPQAPETRTEPGLLEPVEDVLEGVGDLLGN